MLAVSAESRGCAEDTILYAAIAEPPIDSDLSTASREFETGSFMN